MGGPRPIVSMLRHLLIPLERSNAFAGPPLPRKQMPRRIDRKIARRAVDAWFRRLLRAARRQRAAMVPAPVARQAARAQRHTREALVEAVVDSRLREDLCRDAQRGKKELARRLRERSEVVQGPVERLEEVVSRDPDAEQRYRPVIEGTRGLLDPRGPDPGELFREICLVVSLSRRDRVPWARRR